MAYKNQIKTALLHFIIVLALLLSAAGIGYLLCDLGSPEANIVIVFFLTVLLASLLVSNHAFTILASVLAAFLFNSLLTEPHFSLAVNVSSYMITLLTVSIAALLTSTVTLHAEWNKRSTKERGLESRTLYASTNLLVNAKIFPKIAELATDTISKSICADTACLCLDENGKSEDSYIQCLPRQAARRRTGGASDILQRLSDLGTGFVTDPALYDWLIYVKDSILGLIRLPKEKTQRLSLVQVRTLCPMTESTALAVDRFRTSWQRIRLHEETVRERYRVNLLRAISHDLRMPLAGTMGTSEVLLGVTDSFDPRYLLTEGIHHDADWLHSLIESILSLTRLQDGMLAISKQMEAAEEILNGAACYVMHHHLGYDVEVRMPGELFLVPVDVKLVSQALINLLKNAIKHTDPPDEICVSVEKDKEDYDAVSSVRDRSNGIGGADLPYIFGLFYASHAKESNSCKGVGLGLAICDAVIKAHGGTIQVRNRIGGPGAESVFSLPLEEKNHG